MQSRRNAHPVFLRPLLSARAPLAAAAVLIFVSTSMAAPVLSERVRELIDEKGVEAARQEVSMLIVTSRGELEPDEEGMLTLADDYLDGGNVDAAEMVVHMQMIVGNSADVAAKLGDVYMAKGVPLAASAFYQQALQADPGHGHAKKQLALIAEKHPEVPGLVPIQQPPPPAKPAEPARTPATTGTESASEPAPRGGGDTLLPLVLVTDADAVESLDWSELRKEAGTDYPSRWDDLTLVDSCLWIPPEELEEHLGLSARLTSKRTDFQCKYWVHFSDDDSTVMLQVYVEYHQSAEKVRENESGFSEGISGRQFTPFDPGAPDLNVYLHKKGKYLYVFPRDGVTMWRIGFMGDGPERDRIYRPGGETGLEQGLGARFMRLLVEKYGGRL